MARSKSISDEALLDGLRDAITEWGPAGLTFAKASRAVGLSPATLVQRFGTLDAMIEALLLRAWDQLDAATAAADAEAPLTPAGAIDLIMRLMPAHEVEYNVTDGLLLLREDLRNPVLRARGQAWGHRLAQCLGRRLTRQPDLAARLGWQMASVWQGALVWWAFTRGAHPEVAIKTMLEDWCRTAKLL